VILHTVCIEVIYKTFVSNQLKGQINLKIVRYSFLVSSCFHELRLSHHSTK